MLNSKTLIKEGLLLTPEERYLVIEALVKSLDSPNVEIDNEWIEEAEARLQAYKEGKLETISMEEMFS